MLVTSLLTSVEPSNLAAEVAVLPTVLIIHRCHCVLRHFYYLMWHLRLLDWTCVMLMRSLLPTPPVVAWVWRSSSKCSCLTWEPQRNIRHAGSSLRPVWPRTSQKKFFMILLGWKTTMIWTNHVDELFILYCLNLFDISSGLLKISNLVRYTWVFRRHVELSIWMSLLTINKMMVIGPVKAQLNTTTNQAACAMVCQYWRC